MVGNASSVRKSDTRKMTLACRRRFCRNPATGATRVGPGSEGSRHSSSRARQARPFNRRGGRYCSTSRPNARNPRLIWSAAAENTRHAAMKSISSFLSSAAVPKAMLAEEIERHDDVQLALGVRLTDERLPQPRRHVPVDPPHVVSGTIGPVLVEVEPRPARARLV